MGRFFAVLFCWKEGGLYIFSKKRKKSMDKSKEDVI